MSCHSRLRGSFPSAAQRSSALPTPFLPEPGHNIREAQAVLPLERTLSHAVVRTRRLSVAVRAQRHTRVVRGLHRYATVLPGVCGFGASFDPAAGAGKCANPGSVSLIARWSFARRSGSPVRRPPAKEGPGNVGLELFSDKHDCVGWGGRAELAARPPGLLRGLRDRGKLGALDVSRDQQRARFFGLDAALVGIQRTLQNLGIRVDERVGLVHQQRVRTC